MPSDPLIDEKIEQAIEILREKNVDLWLTFVRESSTTPDPVLELILGTSVTWQSAFVLTASGERVAIVGSLDVANIRDHGHYAEVIGYKESIRKPLLESLARFNPATIAINFSKNDVLADGLTHGMFLLLRDYLKDSPFADRLVSSEKVVAALRGRKSATEIERIRRSIQLALQMFATVDREVRVGMTEREVAEIMKREMKRAGVTPAWDPDYCPSVFTGPESAGAHAGPTDRRIEAGHLMNIDFGVILDDYASDLQRTWYFRRPGENEAPEAVQRGFETIRDAITRAAEALRPGVEGWRVDQVARQYIVDQGFEEFPHALGHQLGRRAHDGAGLLCPRWERYGDLPYEKVEAGQVYTLEPRLTVPGHGVATIEEIVVVREEGAEFLSERQMELLLK